jgi:hypothetical protein
MVRGDIGGEGEGYVREGEGMKLLIVWLNVEFF